MKVKQSVLDKVNNVSSRMNIAKKLSCGEQAIALQMRRNKDNGRLTKMDAVMAISEESGFPVDQILVDSKVLA